MAQSQQNDADLCCMSLMFVRVRFHSHSKVCFPYHQCLNSNFFGDYEWNQKLKPIEGFPLYAGWIEAFTLAFERGKNGVDSVTFASFSRSGLNVQCPLLCLSSDKSRIATRYMPELATEDALVSVKEA